MLPYVLGDWQRLKQFGGLKVYISAPAIFEAISIIVVYEHA
jgi:hypothetical protein